MAKTDLLYHASYTVIESIDLTKCRKRNDFGRGFYLTTSRRQAYGFVKTSVKKAGTKAAFGFVNAYSMIDPGHLAIFEFSVTGTEWLHCVCSHRREDTPVDDLEKWNHYDIVAGKIANDDTMMVLGIYISGGYGEYGSAEAMDTAIRLLKPERLTDQLCFKTEKAINSLRFTEAFEVLLE